MTEPGAEKLADQLRLPPPPERPDCCGGGCAVCVLDGYAEEVEIWQRQVADIQRRRAEAGLPPAE